MQELFITSFLLRIFFPTTYCARRNCSKEMDIS